MNTSTIKVWLLAALMGLGLSAWGQSKLPPCPTIGYKDNCFGASQKGSVIYNGDLWNYVGEFKNDQFNGQGEMTNRAETRYVGEFLNGRPIQAVVSYKHGARYVGELENGVERTGRGTYTFPSGEMYVGDFRNDNLNGVGTYFYTDGTAYVGTFAGGWRVGQGVLYSKSGEILQAGFWANNEFRYTAQVDGFPAPKSNPTSFAAPSPVEAVTPGLIGASQPQPTATTQSPAPFIGKRVALVIGNASYKIHPLRNPRNDADDMSRSLKGNGFEVIDLRDANIAQMRSAIRQFGDKLLTSDTGLVYYSGHGIEVRGRNYFIPVNADIQREDEVADQSFDVALILEKMSTAQKAVNILIVDACRDDPFGRSFRSSSRGLASMEAPHGTIVAYATSPGKVAADGDGRNSPYTKHLIRAMQAPNKPVELVFKEVRRAVQDETKFQQTPWENTSLSGDFYFKVQK